MAGVPKKSRSARIRANGTKATGASMGSKHRLPAYGGSTAQSATLPGGKLPGASLPGKPSAGMPRKPTPGMPRKPLPKPKKRSK